MKKNEEYMLEHAGLCRAADRLEPQMSTNTAYRGDCVIRTVTA